MENDIGVISNTLSSFGKLNAILFFEKQQDDLQNIYLDLVNTFKPIKTSNSFFNLSTGEMKTMDTITSFKNGNVIAKTILIGQTEEIILENFNSGFIVEHLCYSENLQRNTGHELIRKYLMKEQNSILILGYELSIDVETFNESIDEVIGDVSCHPIAIVKSVNGRLERKEYISDSSATSNAKIGFIQKYLERIRQ